MFSRKILKIQKYVKDYVFFVHLIGKYSGLTKSCFMCKIITVIQNRSEGTKQNNQKDGN